MDIDDDSAGNPTTSSSNSPSASTPSPPTTTTNPAKPTPTTRIHELLAIDKTVPHLLTSASHAIRALTTPPPPSNESSSADILETQKAQFETHTTAFYTHIQSISAHLRRQVYALEEAGIIAAEVTSSRADAKPNTANTGANGGAPRGVPGGLPPATGMQGVAVEPPMQVTNAGMGNLDVGWLNSRRDEVGRRKEGELWAEARGKVEGLLARERNTERANGTGDAEVRNGNNEGKEDPAVNGAQKHNDNDETMGINGENEDDDVNEGEADDEMEAG